MTYLKTLQSLIDELPILKEIMDMGGVIYGGLLRTIVEESEAHEYLKKGGDIDIKICTSYNRQFTKKHFIKFLKGISESGSVNFRGNNYKLCDSESNVMTHNDDQEINDNMRLWYGNYICHNNGLKYDIMLCDTQSQLKMNDFSFNQLSATYNKFEISPETIEVIKSKKIVPICTGDTFNSLKCLYRSIKFYKRGYIPSLEYKKFWITTIKNIDHETYKNNKYISVREFVPIEKKGYVCFNANDLELLVIDEFLSNPIIQEIKEKYIDNDLS